MSKQLQTALEARRWMVANQGCRLKDVYLGRWQWEESSAQFIIWAKGADYPSDDHAPFTIIDEPEVKTDPQDGTLYRPDWAGGNQPEWVRVEVTPYANGVTQSTYHRYAKTASLALKHICQHAQQVWITYPDWSVAHQRGHFYDMEDLDFNEEMELLYALQIGAVVEYLPKEGK